MGYDMITSIWHKTEEGTWQEMKMMTGNNHEVDLFPSRDGMFNQVMLGYNRHSYDMEPIAWKRGLPDWYVKARIDEGLEDDWWDNREEAEEYWETHKTADGTYYDYLELIGYASNSNWRFKDWIASEECGRTIKRNPIGEFISTASRLVEAYGIYNPLPGEIMVVCEASF